MGGEKLERFQQFVTPVNGRVVRRLYNLSPSESKDGMLNKIWRSPFKLVEYENPFVANDIKYVDESDSDIVMVNIVNKSSYENPKNRYGLFEFTFYNSGMYVLQYFPSFGPPSGYIIFKIE